MHRNQAASEQLERSAAAAGAESWRQESFSSELPEGSKTKRSSFDSGVCSIAHLFSYFIQLNKIVGMISFHCFFHRDHNRQFVCQHAQIKRQPFNCLKDFNVNL